MIDLSKVEFTKEDKRELKKYCVKALCVFLIVLSIIFYVDSKIDEIYLKETYRAEIYCKYKDLYEYDTFSFNVSLSSSSSSNDSSPSSSSSSSSSS